MAVKEFVSKTRVNATSMYSFAISTKLNQEKKIKTRDRSILVTITPRKKETDKK